MTTVLAAIVAAPFATSFGVLAVVAINDRRHSRRAGWSDPVHEEAPARLHTARRVTHRSHNSHAHR